MRNLPAIAALGFLLTLAAGVGTVSADPACLEQVAQHCTSCHYKTRICTKIDKKNNRAWQKTIKRMLRDGLKLEKAEQKAIAECLVALKENPQSFCD